MGIRVHCTLGLQCTGKNILIGGQYNKHATQVARRIVAVPICCMVPDIRDDVGVQHSDTIKKGHRFVEIKLRVKHINRSIIVSTPMSGKKDDGSPSSGAIHKRKFGYRQTYYSGKYTIIEVCKSPQNSGKNRQYEGILVSEKIIISGHVCGCTRGGRFVRHHNGSQDISGSFII